MTLLSVSRLVQMRNRQMRVMSFSLGAARQSMLRKSHVMPDLCIARVAYSRVMYKYHGLTCGTFAFQQIPSARRDAGQPEHVLDADLAEVPDAWHALLHVHLRHAGHLTWQPRATLDVAMNRRACQTG